MNKITLDLMHRLLDGLYEMLTDPLLQVEAV